MAVTLTGTSPGNQGLFNRLGVLGGAINDVNAARAAIYASASDALALFDGANTTIRDAVSDLTGAALSQIAQLDSYPSVCSVCAADTGIEMFDADQPMPTRDVATFLDRLRKQMLTATTTYVDANTISATPTQTGLTGNGVIVASVKDGRGINLENLLAERLEFTCVDNTIEGSETIRVLGEEAEADRLSWRWPRGSGSNYALTSVDAMGSSNLLANGGFELFTVADTPDDWEIVVGAAGTDINEETSVVFAGESALAIVGDGATLSQIRQELIGLESLTPYAVNFWGKTDSTPSGGAMRVDLYDGTDVINDEAGNANSLSIDLTTIGTDYVAKNAVFRLPEPVPATVYLRVRLSTALETAKIAYIDHLALAEMEQPSREVGAVPFLKVFSGSVGWSTDDGLPTLTNTFKVETANANESLWQQMFARMFGTPSTGFTLPTSGSTLINDSLIA